MRNYLFLQGEVESKLACCTFACCRELPSSRWVDLQPTRSVSAGYQMANHTLINPPLLGAVSSVAML